jgi:hypothetical protein
MHQENAIPSGQYRFSASLEDLTAEPLLLQGDEAGGEQTPHIDTAAIIGFNRINHYRTPAKSDAHREKNLETLTGWPSLPKSIKTPVYIRMFNGIFDILLLACSAAFFAFALIVMIHNHDSTAEYPRLTKT